MRYVARKPLTLASRHFPTGETVVLDGVEAGLVKKLIDQRRIIPAPEPVAAHTQPKPKKTKAQRKRSTSRRR